MKVGKLCLVYLVVLLNAGALYAQGTHELDLATAWKFQADPANIGLQKGWQSPGFDSSSWPTIPVPGNWESRGITQPNPNWKDDDLNQPYTGYAWYRHSTVIPSDWKGRDVFLNLGPVDDLDWTYVNGVLVGQTTTRTEAVSGIHRSYLIPQSVIKLGLGQPNVIAVRVLDMRGIGGITTGPVSLTLDKPADGRPGGADKVQVMSDITVGKNETVKDAVATMGDIVVLGHVTGDAVAVMGDVTVEPGGRVDGDTVAVMGKVIRKEGATIGGQTSTVGSGGVGFGKWWPTMNWGGLLASSIIGFGVALLSAVLAAVIVALFPAKMDVIADAALGRAGASALYGLLGLLLAAPLAIVLVLTCVGILVVPIWIAFLMVAWIAGGIGMSLALGRRIGDALGRPITSGPFAALIGGILLAVIQLVPFAGDLAAFILTLMGFGAVLMTGFGANPNWLPMRLGGRGSNV